MSHHIYRIIATLLFLVAGATPVTAATIDFEEFSVGDGPTMWGPGGVDSIQSMGFDIAGGSATGPAEILIGDNGTKVFGGSISAPGQDGFGYAVQIVLQRSGGGAFAVHSLDLFSDTDEFGSVTLKTGPSGSHLTDPVGTGAWLNLNQLYITAEGNGFGFGYATLELDNVVVSAVPVPAAVWLFGSALAGLGWLRRKQTV